MLDARRGSKVLAEIHLRNRSISDARTTMGSHNESQGCPIVASSLGIQVGSCKPDPGVDVASGGCKNDT